MGQAVCYQQAVSCSLESHVWKLGQLRVTDSIRKGINVKFTEVFLVFSAKVAPYHSSRTTNPITVEVNRL